MEQTITKVIEIENGNEYRILVDDIYSTDKFFYPVYRKSSELVNEIYLNNKRSCDPVSGSFPNNIIMYCAERGSGKSSAMASFANELNGSCDEKKVQGFTTENNRWNVIKNKCAFTVLDVIDPTLIGEKEMFMRVFLSRLFTVMRNHWDENDSKSQRADNNFFTKMDSNKANIAEQFEKCYRLLDVIYQKGGTFDCNEDLYDLTDLGDSSYLRKELSELINKCLKELHGKTDDVFLVIQIDDTDLNTKMAYNIIEDIRKYCIIPNVIILMAVNIEQMIKVIEQHFITDFKTLLDEENKSSENVKSFGIQDCRNMAEKYIDKVMPAGHRINLPRIDDLIRNNSSSLTVKYMVPNKNEKEIEEKIDILDFGFIEDYQDRLIRLIYNKTGIALVKPQNYLHNLLPTTLRELAHFLSYMYYLPDIYQSVLHDWKNGLDDMYFWVNNVSPQDETQKIKDNIDEFEKYFIHNWCKAQLSQPHYLIIHDLTNIASNQKIASAIGKLENMLPKDETDDVIGSSQDPSPNSYAMLQKKIDQFVVGSGNADNIAEIYRFSYALRFYFMLFFYREYVVSVSRSEGLSSLFRAANYEFWTSYLSAHSPAAKYGRFEVNYNILSKAYGINIFNEDQEKINKIKDCCYINIRGVNYALDISDPLIVDELSAITGNCGSDDPPKIFFDIVYEMLNRSDGNFYSLAFSWDLQHKADKSFRLYEDLRFDTDRRESLIHAIGGASKSIAYDPTWTYSETDGQSKQIIQKLQLSNKELAIEFVNNLFEKINMCFYNISFPEDKNKADGFIDSIESINQLSREMDKLKIISPISEGVKELVMEWENIVAYLSQLQSFTIYFSNKNGKLPAKIKNALYSVTDKMKSPFDVWKEHIKDTKTLAEITAQIILSFMYYPFNKPESENINKTIPLESEKSLTVQSEQPKKRQPRRKTNQ